MDLYNPSSLGKLCANVICNNFDKLFKVEDANFYTRYGFLHPNVLMPKDITEKILNEMVNSSNLTDNRLQFFNKLNVRLENVKLANTNLSNAGIKVLTGHTLQTLECVNLKHVNVDNILRVIHPDNAGNLLHLNVSKCSYSNTSSLSKIVTLENLVQLNVSNTTFDQNSFEVICTDLIHLKHVNISSTSVTRLTPLIELKDTLTTLIMRDNGSNTVDVLSTLQHLTNLEHLDLSLSTVRNGLRNPRMVQIFDKLNYMPKLEHLDVSGWRENVSERKLKSFFESHEFLSFLGIFYIGITHRQRETDSSIEHNKSNLTITGTGNLEEMFETLRRYSDRPAYVTRALLYMDPVTQLPETENPSLLQLILRCMEQNSFLLELQRSAIVCVFNLIKGEKIEGVSTKLVKHIVRCITYAMFHYSNDITLVKHGLKIFGIPKVMNDETVNISYVIMFAFEPITKFRQTDVTSPAIYAMSQISFKFTNKIRTELMQFFPYIRTLIHIERYLIESRVPDEVMVQFLTVFTNFVNECHESSYQFVQNPGFQMIVNILSIYACEHEIKLGVLKLMTALIPTCNWRCLLSVSQLLPWLIRFLYDDSFHISFLSAGLVAAAATCDPIYWQDICIDANRALGFMYYNMINWTPTKSAISYTTFIPFFILLRPGRDHRIGLWALFAIDYMFTVDEEKYVRMFIIEGGHVVLRVILNEPRDPSVINATRALLNILNLHNTKYNILTGRL